MLNVELPRSPDQRNISEINKALCPCLAKIISLLVATLFFPGTNLVLRLSEQQYTV
jgi:hypothetical protein